MFQLVNCWGDTSAFGVGDKVLDISHVIIGIIEAFDQGVGHHMVYLVGKKIVDFGGLGQLKWGMVGNEAAGITAL